MAAPEKQQAERLDALLEALGAQLKRKPKAGALSTEFWALALYGALVAADGWLGLDLSTEVLLSLAGTVAAYIGQRAFVKRRQ